MIDVLLVGILIYLIRYILRIIEECKNDGQGN